jgi:Rho GTPase-activating protein 1
VSLPSFGDPHVAAVLLKKFFRDLPHPVFPESMYPAIQACPVPTLDPTDRSCIDYICRSLLPRVEDMSPATLMVLSYVLRACSSPKNFSANLS